MSWQFWKKADAEGAAEKGGKLPKPKDINGIVGRKLVVDFSKDPDWVWSLKSVERPKTNEKSAFDVRVFNGNQALSKRVPIKDYNSLDDHPELILFEGWYDKRTAKVDLKEMGAARKRPEAA